MKEELSIKVLPMIAYNQIQAIHFKLSATKAILMNYFSYVLPNYGEVVMIGDAPHYWCGANKILQDMPTLEMSESTLKRDIRELIDAGLIRREIVRVGKDRAYYRVCDERIMYGSEAPSINTTNSNKSILDQLSSLSNDDKERIMEALKKEQEEKTNITFDLDDVGGNFYTDAIVKALKDNSKCFQFKAIINFEYMSELMEHIESRASLCKWYKLGVDGKKTSETQKEIVRVFKNMLEWYVGNNKKVKNLKLTINTWMK